MTTFSQVSHVLDVMHVHIPEMPIDRRPANRPVRDSAWACEVGLAKTRTVQR